MGWTIPPPEEVLAGLKDFQRATVEHVFSRLYAEDASGRYRVADEVGLGKNLVARGVIAKTIARLKAEMMRSGSSAFTQLRASTARRLRLRSGVRRRRLEAQRLSRRARGPPEGAGRTMDDLGVYATGLSSRLAPLLRVPLEPGELAA